MAKKADAGIIDLRNLPEGGGSRFRVPEGDYPFKVKSVSFDTSQSGNAMFVWEFVGTSGRVKGKVLKEYTSLSAKALWKLASVIEAITGKLPAATSQKALLAYCKKLVGKEVGISLEDDEYTNDSGKTSVSSKASDFVNIDDLGSEPDDDEDDDVEDEDDVEVEDDDDEDEDDDESEDDEDEFDEMDRAALKKHIKAEGLDIKVTKSMDDDAIRDAIRELTDDEDEDEDDEDDDGLDELDRSELKARLKKADPKYKVKKSDTDDDLRSKIRDAEDGDEDDEEEIEDVDLDEL